ncbi:MAG TPA: biosynthetic-type acetolactate synthase large subunit, partial [Euryarchaeota archaeon]|nr:biosynthetic-type acetolactate synthase large subunit [Euryarchaeota archaeon]
ATSGPGATNLTTGIANAYMDSSPIVAITGQVPRAFIGKDAFQETDIIGITMPVTKQSFQLRSVAEIPEVIKSSFYIAKTGRPGPVLIDIPRDIQEIEDEIDFNVKLELKGYKPTLKGHPRQIKEAAKLILEAERPVIIAGGGVIISEASEELMELARLIGAPVTTTLMGKGSFPEMDPLALGVLGMHGRKVANYAVTDSDVLISIGMRFSDRSTGVVSCFAPDAKIIHIDIDPAEIGKNVSVDIPVVGDAKTVLKELIRVLRKIMESEKSRAWQEKIKIWKKEFSPKMDYDDVPLKPHRVIKEIMDFLGEDDIVTTEVGQCQMWAHHYMGRSKPRSFISSGGLGTMGFGFPAAMGAKVAKPDVNVIDIAGDGSFLMNIQELATVVENNINVVVGVFDNHYLGMVRQWQELFYDRRYSSVYLGNTLDFVKVAEGFGALGIRVEKPEEIKPALKEAFNAGKPVVLDFMIEHECNIFPMVPPGRCLKDIME